MPRVSDIVVTVQAKLAKANKTARRDANRIKDMAAGCLKLLNRVGNPEVQAYLRDNLTEIERTATAMDARTGKLDPSLRSGGESKKKRTAKRKA